MENIIEVKNISKKYNIGERQIYLTLRDIIINIVRSPLKLFGERKSGVFNDGKTGDFWALKNVSFTVKKGEMLGIIGRNGAGKSTLLKILTQITPPTTGEVRLRGRVGSLLEVGTGFHQELSGRENIYLNGSILGMSKKEIDRKFDQIVEFADIGKFLDVPVKRYSSGMQVRLAFSVAAHLEPEILLVDEVLAVGDADFQKKCLGKMEEVTKKDGRTVIFVSHNLGAVKTLCNKCLFLDGGEVKSWGDTDQVISDYLCDNAMVSNIEIAPNQHSKGNGDVLITKASIKGEGDVPKNTFLINEKIKFSIQYNIAKEDRDISFCVTFLDNERMPLLSSLQKDTGKLIKPKLGLGNVEVEFENIGLFPGTYTVALGVLKHDNLLYWEYADWIDGCFTIDVTNEFADGRHFDGRIGKIIKQATWN